ncbi:Similar to Putative ankyrin repeat protein RBE_0317; acc. no. Q1RJR6 [Pyronema omphalodes CBS 100304]|uniref:Similar to Putative ankyrin repeat protein RBE_0317 acc. no. Q1RJR6 n=1 Tax=Pyronema omphalodes (strain CBS 100304) TaxID=1076935 RepID=U4LMF2_PYROM|nr:Similar to Putative ankyrin repeat protein RBE_0317; acc. no. Q1RJR6 [Pyronema omphalodes CBS 100304]
MFSLFSCENSCEDVVKLLLSREDIEVNAKDNDGKTELKFACDNGREGAVELLLAREDVEVNAKDTFGTTALMWASPPARFANREPISSPLLDWKDIDVDAKDNDGNTAPTHAVSRHHDGIAKQIRQFMDEQKVV